MHHVQSIILGANQSDQLGHMKAILEKGFPDGVIAICPTCNAVKPLTLDQAAKHTVSRTWPYCHDKKMLMADPDDAPPF